MAGETKPRKRMGRPRKEIDWQAFDALCKLQCTLIEIAGFFDVSPDTIERAVKREHRTTFAAYFKAKAAGGRASLRRAQFQLANKGNATMLIWLGKQWLGQRDKFDHEVTGAGGGPVAVAVEVKLTEQEAADLYRSRLARP